MDIRCKRVALESAGRAVVTTVVATRYAIAHKHRTGWQGWVRTHDIRRKSGSSGSIVLEYDADVDGYHTAHTQRRTQRAVAAATIELYDAVLGTSWVPCAERQDVRTECLYTQWNRPWHRIWHDGCQLSTTPRSYGGSLLVMDIR